MLCLVLRYLLPGLPKPMMQKSIFKCHSERSEESHPLKLLFFLLLLFGCGCCFLALFFLLALRDYFRLCRLGCCSSFAFGRCSFYNFFDRRRYYCNNRCLGTLKYFEILVLKLADMNSVADI